jgi:hypothetical protein
MKLFKPITRTKPRGQSFIELALVFMVLMFLFAGVVELGNLINIYLDIIDSGREAARFSNAVSFYKTDPVTHVKYIGNDVYDKTAQVAWATLNPACHLMLPNKPGAPNCPADEMKIRFDPAKDDIVVSIISYDGSTLLRFPTMGWSRFGNHTSTVTDGQIISQLDPSAPNTGIVMVEIFYDYHQLLGMPFFTDVIPDPIPVHTFSIMPYPGAEPTPTPLP